MIVKSKNSKACEVRRVRKIEIVSKERIVKITEGKEGMHSKACEKRRVRKIKIVSKKKTIKIKEGKERKDCQ